MAVPGGYGLAAKLPRGRHDLQVLARHQECAVVGAVEALYCPDQVAGERLSTGLVQRLESFHRRAVIRAEEVEVLLRPSEAPDEGLPRRLHRYDAVADEVAHPIFCAPAGGRPQSSGRRGVAAGNAQHLADPAFGAPTGEADPAAGPANS